jgi:hypothetical protein
MQQIPATAVSVEVENLFHNFNIVTHLDPAKTFLCPLNSNITHMHHWTIKSMEMCSSIMLNLPAHSNHVAEQIQKKWLLVQGVIHDACKMSNIPDDVKNLHVLRTTVIIECHNCHQDSVYLSALCLLVFHFSNS